MRRAEHPMIDDVTRGRSRAAPRSAGRQRLAGSLSALALCGGLLAWGGDARAQRESRPGPQVGANFFGTGAHFIVAPAGQGPFLIGVDLGYHREGATYHFFTQVEVATFLDEAMSSPLLLVGTTGVAYVTPTSPTALLVGGAVGAGALIMDDEAAPVFPVGGILGVEFLRNTRARVLLGLECAILVPYPIPMIGLTVQVLL